jgi:transglutaminase-like putative cysteine protease
MNPRLGLPLLLALSACAVPPANAPTPLQHPLAADRPAEELAARLVFGSGVEADPDIAAAILESNPAAADPMTETLLGMHYEAGKPGVANPEKAAYWLQKAADRGQPLASTLLALLLIKGEGVPRDYDRARRLLDAPAKGGFGLAEGWMGVLYQNGWGVAQDDRIALDWHRKAADHGNQSSFFLLGVAARDGKGMETDRIAAYAWFDLAVAKIGAPAEREHAVQSRDQLALLLLPNEIGTAKRMAAAWKPGTDMAELRQHLGADTTTVATVAPPARLDPTGGTITHTVAAGPAPSSTPSPVTERLAATDVEVHPDGSHIDTVHRETLITNDSAAKQFSQVPLEFDSDETDLTITEAYTLKPDGKKLPVETSAIYTQPAPGAPSLPMFTGLKAKVIVFPWVEAGDVLVYTAKYDTKAYFPNAFTRSNFFVPTRTVLDDRVTIRTPLDMPLITESHDVTASERVEGDAHVYEWRYTNPVPVKDLKLALDPHDRLPRYAASSFKNYEAMAASYVALAAPKATVTPEVQRLADQITTGISGHRAQAAAIYDWVSRHVRYVGLELGIGAIVPHEASTVIANGYGDCKDHSVLFQALLKAKGIASELVIINLGDSYSLPKPPVMGSLNHEILYLPEFSMYADTTAGVAPFGTLPFGEYGKPVIHATLTAPALRRTPSLSPASATLEVHSTTHLAADGSMTGESEAKGTGVFGIGMRAAATGIQSAGPDQIARSELRSEGFEGSGDFTFDPLYGPATAFTVKAHFEAKPRVDLVSGNGFAPPRGLSVAPRPGDGLLGALGFLDAGGTEPTPCYPGREVEELSMELPAGSHLRDLPKGHDITNDVLTFHSTWSQNGRTVTVRREFVSLVTDPVCVGRTRQLAAWAINQIRGDYATEIAVVKD